MKTVYNPESLLDRPSSGLSVVERALLGSPSAADLVVTMLPVLVKHPDATRMIVRTLPELNKRVPSGLSPLEWTALGLQQAIDFVAHKIKSV